MQSVAAKDSGTSLCQPAAKPPPARVSRRHCKALPVPAGRPALAGLLLHTPAETVSSHNMRVVEASFTQHRALYSPPQTRQERPSWTPVGQRHRVRISSREAAVMRAPLALQAVYGHTASADCA